MMINKTLEDVCENLLISYSGDNWTKFCFCKHTLEHMGFIDSDYWECLKYIAKRLDVDKDGHNV